MTIVSLRGGENAVNALQAKVDSLTNVVSSQQTSISTMRDSIAVPPASGRPVVSLRLNGSLPMSRLQKLSKEIAAYSHTFQIHRKQLSAPPTESINSKLAAIEAEKRESRLRDLKYLKTI